MMFDALADETGSYQDERLGLLFVCAHPAIDPAIRAPLMLQVVLGIDAGRIAGAFLVAPATMGQRLVRAKARIRDAGIRFEPPSGDEMPSRLPDVLDAIYAAFGMAWDGISGVDASSAGLAEEAIYLGRILVSLLPKEPEAKGLLALMLYCEARRSARRSAAGEFIPLDRQDARLWSRDMIIEAEQLMTEASRSGQFGRFQCEAAIQSVHVQRPILGRTNYQALTVLYELLARHVPGAGAVVGLAAVLIEAGATAKAMTVLDGLAADTVTSYQPYWVTRARLMHALGRSAQARHALQTAIGLTDDPSIRRFLTTLLDG